MQNYILFLFDTQTHLLLRAPVTLALVVLTIFVSWRAFEDSHLKSKMLFNPFQIQHRGEWYRFLSHGLIHADGIHLAFNMFVLWEFGGMVENTYKLEFGELLGAILYLLLYVSGLITSSLYSFFQHHNNPAYNSLGASGAVSGILFACILFMPLMPLRLMLFPFFPIPAVVMGVLYLIYSSYMSKHGHDNIGHDAHFWGGVWGFLFTIALNIHFLEQFLQQIQESFF